jgi:hypothetical protein
MARKRGSRKLDRMCGCKLVSVKGRGGSTRAALRCPGSPMFRFVSREEAAKLKGRKDICTEMLRPIR